MEIGLFQLENLLYSRNMFLLIDLRPPGLSTPEALLGPLKSTQRLAPGQVEEFLETSRHLKERPLVLLCEDGTHSRRLAGKLEQKGYSNVCVVADGVVGLLSEV